MGVFGMLGRLLSLVEDRLREKAPHVHFVPQPPNVDIFSDPKQAAMAQPAPAFHVFFKKIMPIEHASDHSTSVNVGFWVVLVTGYAFNKVYPIEIDNLFQLAYSALNKWIPEMPENGAVFCSPITWTNSENDYWALEVPFYHRAMYFEVQYNMHKG